MPSLTDLLQLGPAAGAVLMAFLFLKHIKEENKANRQMWDNHLSGTVKALTQIHEEQKRQGEEARVHYKKKTK